MMDWRFPIRERLRANANELTSSSKQTKKYMLEFEIQGLPSTPNARLHWAKRAKEVKKWRALVVGTVFRHRPGTPLKLAKITYTRCSSVEPDTDNGRASFKAIQDGLVEAGIIENDKTSVIGDPAYSWEPASPKGGKIKVRVEGVG